MWQEMKVTVRKFEFDDIPNKVRWVNDDRNNQYLHYDIPISIKKTEEWFYSHKGETTRYDAIIEADGIPVGTIGLLGIDYKNSKAEYYIAMGEPNYKGKGIAKEASQLVLKYGFETLGLNRIYLLTETKNYVAQILFERLGFKKEGCLRNDIFSHGRFADRFAYGMLKEDWDKRE